ncbi:MAG TPA: hypothetical protein VNL77_15100, partial [Roseiflexaceae bacterium]|nr:hypothetical protein [Roseiflexaceae bacterium]
FGAATMAALGLIEPLGVFHDSWQNVGLGQLALAPAIAGDTAEVEYVAGSPAAFLLFGLLRGGFGATPALLRAYPAICLLLYTAGLYTLASAFVAAHPRLRGLEPARAGWMAAFAFLALAPTFWMRINPAPQSLAFALMPFCLAALLRATADARFRVVALATFGAIVLTHPITALMTVGVTAAWLALDAWKRWRTRAPALVASNTVLLYACLFVSWLIYIGVWVLRSGEAFARRIGQVFNSGEHATVTATVTEQSLLFVWLHRVALLGAAALVAVGMLVLLRSSRSAAARLAAWFAIAAIWLPMMLFGEFGDRGPLFASLPASLAAALALCLARRRAVRGALAGLLLLTALTGHITAYANHIGEVITRAEVDSFDVIVEQAPQSRIAYGYGFPLAAPEDLPTYRSARVRVYAVGAADFTFDRLLDSSDVIVISDQMRESALLRGPRAAEALARFERYLRDQVRFEIIYDSGSVRAYRVR